MVSFLLSFSLLFATFQQSKPEPLRVDGFTMGTTYHVTYFDQQQRNFSAAIDSLLGLVNKSISTYDSTSEISKFNDGAGLYKFSLPYFYPPLKTSKEVFEASDGAFDPTVKPLVDLWGFGPRKNDPVEPKKIDSLRHLIGFEKITFDPSTVTKSNARVQLDFGGIGQGYGADVIADYLRGRGITNYLVELGGEGIASGRNLQKDAAWTIGILNPNSTPEEQFYQAYVKLTDRAFTTSGNYFNYRIIDGKKYGHTIDPKTGFPVEHNLLSVSVFASECITADAWATAFMAMGLERAKAKLKKLATLDALLIYTNTDGTLEVFCTAGIRKFVTLEKN